MLPSEVGFFMPILIISLEDCDIKGKEITYVMTSEFTKWYLGHKWIEKKDYPPLIKVEGNAKTLPFKRVGMSANFDLYEFGDFLLRVKYRTTSPSLC